MAVQSDQEVEEVVSDGLTLDLTNSHLHSLQDVPLPPTLTVLDLTANRLQSLEPKLLQLTGLQSLSLRQNILEDPSDAARLASAPQLTELILQDNRLSQVPYLAPLTALQRLELSYNGIKSLAPLTSLVAPNLSALYVASNRITSAEGIEHLTSLTLLELGSNRLRSLEPVAGLMGLQELWLGRNRLTSAALPSLSGLTNLKRLALLSNRLDSMCGLSACTALEELYLSHNGIACLEEFEALTHLKILDISNNGVSALPSLGMLTQLQDVWLNDNQLENWPSVLEALKPLRGTLNCLYLANNPASTEKVQADLQLSGFTRLEQLDDKILELPGASRGQQGTGSFGGVGRKLGTA